MEAVENESEYSDTFGVDEDRRQLRAGSQEFLSKRRESAAVVSQSQKAILLPSVASTKDSSSRLSNINSSNVGLKAKLSLPTIKKQWNTRNVTKERTIEEQL